MSYRWLLSVLCCGAVLFLSWPFLAWQWKEEKTLDIAVIDKTVPVEDYREHLGLFWILENSKIVGPDGGLYKADSDYYGNHPREGVAERNLSFSHHPDLIYVADTYGVYRADLTDGIKRGERSELLYGGLIPYEWDQLMKAKDDKTTLILEFNSLASPTSDSVRQMVERSMGFKWSGWIGRYFSDLGSEEVPEWLKSNYLSQTGKPWSLDGEAIVFVDESDRIVLLQAGDFVGKILFQPTEEGKQQYPSMMESEYGYWFDINVPGKSMVVDAMYGLGLTGEGLAKLRENGIPSEFPAVMRDPDRRLYYFSGDYADISLQYFAKLEPSDTFYRLLAMIRKDEQFYWRSYVPMMKQILEQIEANDRDPANQAIHPSIYVPPDQMG